MRKLIVSSVVASLLLPLVASAASAAELQAQAQALLNQVTQLQQQMGVGVDTSSGGGNVGNGGTPSAGCPNIGRTLKVGSSGDDVKALQEYLAQNPTIYPEGSITGYYGNLTMRAVQRWQAQNNIVSSGTPATTGYGMVGPRTAAAIALLCRAGGSGSVAPANTPMVGGFIEVTPISGNAALSVTVKATVNTVNSCGAATYLLDFGDGTAIQQIPVAANTCQPIVQSFTHVYQVAGNFQIQLAAGTHKTSATITVYGMTQPGQPSQPTPVAQPTGSFSANLTTGAAPFNVSFGGQTAYRGCSGCNDVLVFGDGSNTVVSTPSQQGQLLGYSVGHTYTAPGTYTAVLYNGDGAPGQAAVGVVTITVNGYSSGSGAFGIVSVSPSSNPMAIAAQFNVPNCGAYQVDWGDSTPISTVTTDCVQNPTGPQVVNQNHTYNAAGVYTISLKDGNGKVQKTAGVTIQ
jgi:PKD repeat protein